MWHCIAGKGGVGQGRWEGREGGRCRGGGWMGLSGGGGQREGGRLGHFKKKIIIRLLLEIWGFREWDGRWGVISFYETKCLRPIHLPCFPLLAVFSSLKSCWCGLWLYSWALGPPKYIRQMMLSDSLLFTRSHPVEECFWTSVQGWPKVKWMTENCQWLLAGLCFVGQVAVKDC